MGERIGIMGGTFDPIHIGHLILAEDACRQLDLDKVLFMPAGNPPHKLNRQGRASNEDRVEMVRLAIGDNSHFELSLYEMHEEGYSYTYRTLEAMKAEDKEREIFFILGADSLFDFDGWREPGRIAAACTLVAATRHHVDRTALDETVHFLEDKYGAGIVILDTPNIDIASRDIRRWIAAERSVRYYVPEKVRHYMMVHHLYESLPEDSAEGEI